MGLTDGQATTVTATFHEDGWDDGFCSEESAPRISNAARPWKRAGVRLISASRPAPKRHCGSVCPATITSALSPSRGLQKLWSHPGLRLTRGSASRDLEYAMTSLLHRCKIAGTVIGCLRILDWYMKISAEELERHAVSQASRLGADDEECCQSVARCTSGKSNTRRAAVFCLKEPPPQLSVIQDVTHLNATQRSMRTPGAWPCYRVRSSNADADPAAMMVLVPVAEPTRRLLAFGFQSLASCTPPRSVIAQKVGCLVSQNDGSADYKDLTRPRRLLLTALDKCAWFPSSFIAPKPSPFAVLVGYLESTTGVT